MATSPGLEYTSCIKPLLSASFSSFHKNDVPDFAQHIVRSEEELFNHEEKYEVFYCSFAALSAHYIGATASKVQKSNLREVTGACKILMKFLLERVQAEDGDCAISQKNLMSLIRGLCKGNGSLSKADIVATTALLKSATSPPHIRDTIVSESDVGTKKVKMTRLDTESNVFDQLTSVFNEMSPSKVTKPSVSNEKSSTDKESTENTAEQSNEIREIFAEKNKSYLLKINGSTLLLDMCAKLPYLQKYVKLYVNAANGLSFCVPGTLSEALTTRNSYQLLLGDVSTVWKAFSLPILEPLSAKRLENIIQLTMGCLYAAVTVAVSNTILNMASAVPLKAASSTKDEETDNCGIRIVQRALEIFEIVCSTIKNSSRASGGDAQDINLLASWLLCKGLQGILALTPAMILERKESAKGKDATPKTKDSPSRPGSGKSCYQGFGPLSVALASSAVQLITELLADFLVEGDVGEFTFIDPGKAGMSFDPKIQLSSWERLMRLTNQIPLTDLLLNIVTVSFRKAVMLKKLKQGPETSEVSSSSTSDSNTFYEDDFSSSEESSEEEDDDSESILGQLFDEPSPPDITIEESAPHPGTPKGDNGSEMKRSRKLSENDIPSFVPDKREPDGFVTLAAKLLNFLDSYLLNSQSPDIQKLIRNGNGEEHTLNLSIVIRELDRECSKSGTDKIFEDLSVALAKFTHSLIASECLSTKQQDTFLTQLGVCPTGVDTWPLTVYPRTLAVLAEIILLRQQKEREAKSLKSNSEAAILSIWFLFIRTLKTSVINFENKTENFEDINVEHIQLLLFLFHGLPLMQKKTLLLQLAQNIIDVSEVGHSKLQETIPLPLSRMLLVFDYLIHNFYDPQQVLIEQVQWNLFTVRTLNSAGEDENSVSRINHFFACREVEENFKKNTASQECADAALVRPMFYNLCQSDVNNQDTPKVDGLACSFLVSNPECLKYNSLYNACIRLLMAGSKCDKTKEKLTPLEASVMHYHFLILWRLLACLPPSVQYIQSLELIDPNSINMESGHILHTLRWAPRLGHKTFSLWIKDSLVKQGLTTQKAEILLENANEKVNNFAFDVKLALKVVQEQLSSMPALEQVEDVLNKSLLPGLSCILMLDAVIAKVEVSLDDAFTKAMANTDPHKTIDAAQELIPEVFLLIQRYSKYVLMCVMFDLKEEKHDKPNQPKKMKLEAYCSLLSIGSTRSSKVSRLATSIMSLLPSSLRTSVEKWNKNTANEFPSIGGWRNAFANDIIPCESYIDAIHSGHIGTLSGHSQFSVNTSLKHLLHALVRFGSDLEVWCPGSSSSKEMVKVFFPLLFDATTEYIADMISLSLERFLGPSDGDEFVQKMYTTVFSVCNHLISSAANSMLDCKIMQHCLSLMEENLDKPAAKKALEDVFRSHSDMVNMIHFSCSNSESSEFLGKIFKFFNKLLQLNEQYPEDSSYKSLCGGLNSLKGLEHVFERALGIMLIPQKNCEDDTIYHENRLIIRTFVEHIVKEKSPVGDPVMECLLKSLISLSEFYITSLSEETSGFPELMIIMQKLASARTGSGHTILFNAVINWLQSCKTYLSQKEVLDKMLEDSNDNKTVNTSLKTVCCLLSYLGDILAALKKNMERSGAASPVVDSEIPATVEADSDWADDLGHEEEDSAGEDSDEESLNNKLCTFTVTQKEFMNQHWYHCHTCNMDDGVGVCTVCAKVCHKEHDLTYAKFGSFFCDCGAKEDGSCQALMKRTLDSGVDSIGNASITSPFSAETLHPSSLRRRLSSPGQLKKATDSKKLADNISKACEIMCKQVEGSRENFIKNLRTANSIQTVMDILVTIFPPLEAYYEKMSPSGSTTRAHEALEELHTKPKATLTTDLLMTVTLGSQEGAFENVKMNYSGDYGQTIRQLITAHMIRRVAMCVLSSPHGKRQHLAVSHEKGKITILQLSALLKQADSSKKKLTLTRLASAPIPFTVLSISGNPCNEDYLAVCGLKDCHVLTFNSSGAVADHLVLHPSLATGNFIIKALWLPGSQTELAIVTADFVKIYNLAVDGISPQFYFLLPSGKIRDATFVFREDGRFIVLMSSTGYIYTQSMTEDSSAQHGLFYITNVLEMKDPSLKETNGQVAGGGVSIYYSHALQLLFFSYSQGKIFASTLSKDMSSVPALFPILFKSSNGSGKGSNGAQPLVQWSEVPGHTGLMYSMTQTSNNPVILMVKPDAIVVQEIKVVPAKAKMQDVVAIRHTSSTTEQQRTTMILLCEDGSLRIYMANVDNANYWLSEGLQPQSPIAALKPVKKKKSTKSGKGRPAGSVSFPIDFYEHCQLSNDVEYGGNDVLQIYNVQQVRHRLNTTGMYIASTKPAGFTLEIKCTNSASVIVGIRVLVGSQSVERAPSYLEVFGRTTQVNLTKARWYDLPLTREESLMVDKKLSLFVGASVDPAGVTMIDSVRVYIKTKEAFGWPEETDEFPETTASNKVLMQTGVISTTETEMMPIQPQPLTTSDRLLGCALMVLDGMFATVSTEDVKDPPDETVLKLATNLLTLPTPPSVQQHTKSFLASLFSNRTNYHNHKDQVLLSHVMSSLNGGNLDMDVDSFQRLLITARSVAVSRPSNLVRYCTATKNEDIEITDLENEKQKQESTHMCALEQKERRHFISQLIEVFWKLHNAKPANPMLAPVCLPGLVHIDVTVGALVEVIHAFTVSDMESVDLATKHYVKLLLCKDPVVSFACKQAIIRALRPRTRRRRVFIPSPPRCSSPGVGGDDDEDDDDSKKDKPDSTRILQRPIIQQHIPDADEQFEVVDSTEPVLLEPEEQNVIPLEELLAGGRNFPPIVDIPPDADDETMVELAIALSLQDQSGQGSGLGLRALGLGNQGQIASLEEPLEEGPLSDTDTAPGSDDEVGSNAATDGSTLRTSPAEHGGSGAGSESGGSAVDSISVSGRSSAYGDCLPETATAGVRSETSSLGMPSGSMHPEGDGSEGDVIDFDTRCRLHTLRMMLLERLTQYLPKIRDVGGVQVIPFMQVLLMLTSDVDSEEERDKAALDGLLVAILKELDLSSNDVSKVDERTKENEVKLVLLRLLSVLLSKSKTGGKSNESSFICNSTATALISSGTIDYCLRVLKKLLSYWQKFSAPEADGSTLPGQLLKPHPTSSPPDMSPFFLRQYVKGHASDVFEDFPQLLTEMVLRLPYQLKKLADSVASVPDTSFDADWNTIIAEYLMTEQTPFVKRQGRKLLLFICGNKHKYRQLRDLHAIESNLKAVMELCSKGGMSDTTDVVPHSVVLPYDSLLTIIEHLKICSEIATSRPVNWQQYCLKHKGEARYINLVVERDVVVFIPHTIKLLEDVLPFLMKSSIALDEGVASTILQLLQGALCASKSSVSTTNRKDKDKEKESDDEKYKEEELCLNLIQLLNKVTDNELLVNFIRNFLLDSNSTSIRWQAHSLVYNIYRNSPPSQQENLIELMWGLWKELSLYGRKASQFVDLLGFFVLKTNQTADMVKEYLVRAIAVLKEENQVLANHPNATIYNMLQGLVDFDGYYLESDPCLVCNNPEVPYSSLKLSAIKVDSKFTTTTQIVKLVGSHTISKLSLRVSDLKRTKMVRTMGVYYNNRTVQAVVELKNRAGLWHKAKKVTLTAGQTDVKVEFPIPIVACNIMLEYSDFYDNVQATAETLQCPRCSASVPANPGVCGNCGENVFQCHKCRAINYDEKDPFLCNSCGFCKYAKFDYTLTAKPCCAVDPIENEDDRKKAISTINSLLEKADRIYKQLQLHRPALEHLLVQVTEHSFDRTGEEQSSGSAVPGSNVNRAIQQLAQKYCGECKTSFDDLSKIIQKVLACRKELVEYDKQQKEAVLSQAAPVRSTSLIAVEPPKNSAASQKTKKDREGSRPSNCYGCASSAVDHCITLLRALVTNSSMKQILCAQGMIPELIDFNLRLGTLNVRNEVRNLLCMLTKDNRSGTAEMNKLIMMRVSAALKGHQSNPDLGSSVRHEIMLLANSLQLEDSCWEQRVRCLMQMFLMGMNVKHPVVMENITHPCLRILQHLVQLPSSSKADQDENNATASQIPLTDLSVNIKQWLVGDQRASYNNWKKKLQSTGVADAKKKEMRKRYLMEKYATRWRENMTKSEETNVKLSQTTWLQQAMFSPSSRSSRQTACNIVESLAQVPTRRKEILDMLTSCLDQIGISGECSAEYLSLYKRLLMPVTWKYYLALKGVLIKLGDLITKEVDHLQYLEETTLSSDLAQGFALKALTELLAQFVEQEKLKQHYKNRLVGYVLNGYLSLRKLIVQRTKLIDETQEKLLDMLEELTTGTESETREFMSVCVQTVKKYPLDDNRSPVFIFERLCSIIYPEENDVGEFFMILEKDPQQEDFLQGRMLGNPYSSNEPGLGPLMRDVKNKICQDCELVALLEDDTGMELLVNKKIISLDLPVKEVYKKVWAPEHGEGEPMVIIYRMRGLLGDATEDMVNSLETKSDENIDKEEVYKMATVLSECGGLEVMLDRLASIRDLVLGKQLMMVLLKLFGFAVNIKVNRQKLCDPEMNTINIMLGALNLALWSEQESGTSTKGQTVTEQILQIMEVVLLEAGSQQPDGSKTWQIQTIGEMISERVNVFSQLCGDRDQLMMLLDRINSPFVRANNNVLQGLMRLIPFLAFGEDDKMLALIDHFKQYLEFNKFDFHHSQDEQIHVECFCAIASGIESNENGNRLKNLIIEHGIVNEAMEYILMHAPPITTLLATDSDDWKDFLCRPSLSYVLRILTGLCRGHPATQALIGSDLIRILHKLEQVSSDKHIGTMAENLLEALITHDEVKAKIEEIRKQTKLEKKRLAMAVRKKQLGALGMTTNEKGQVTVKSSVLKQMEDLKEETGLTCCICREGYRYLPTKVLAIYTFTKRVVLDEFENKHRKTVGYSTVSHFNVIHVDCYLVALKHARGREEWDIAALQNSNTKCNGLLPMWGPQVQESAFATCLARMENLTKSEMCICHVNEYVVFHPTHSLHSRTKNQFYCVSCMKECTGVRDPSYPFTIHDIKMLLLKFANEKSFSEDSGGGGRQSNVHLLPYLMHMALYVINTTRSVAREEKNFNNFLEMSKDKWVENSFETEGALYYATLAMAILPYSKWISVRVQIVERLMLLTHVRHTTPIESKVVSNKKVEEYSVYKAHLVFFGFINCLYEKLFKKVSASSDWCNLLAEYIRHNDRLVIEACDKVLSTYEEELLPCESLAEFFDVAEMLEEIPNPDEFLANAIASLP